MARGGLSFEGIDYSAVAMQADGSVSAVYLASGAAGVEGKAVTVAGNGIAGFGSAGDAIFGVINHYEADHCMTVQHRGFAVDVPGVSGKLPTAGGFVVCNGDGAVSVAPNPKGPARAVSVDNTADVNKIVLFIC